MLEGLTKVVVFTYTTMGWLAPCWLYDFPCLTCPTGRAEETVGRGHVALDGRVAARVEDLQWDGARTQRESCACGRAAAGRAAAPGEHGRR